ncbi:hypothetical protein FN846DRAFT_906748 [Sphaerosporella brunnea]|uniref:Uncharacterized protein n=1 Tax=Sphaerosporella brunnea TaxID=1250544 RepID=A0A5J5EZ56_9PEZI|nr:hypothetical protein FN846DRAFT_906748 [Sphaerosporella brunnea]
MAPIHGGKMAATAGHGTIEAIAAIDAAPVALAQEVAKIETATISKSPEPKEMPAPVAADGKKRGRPPRARNIMAASNDATDEQNIASPTTMGLNDPMDAMD